MYKMSWYREKIELSTVFTRAVSSAIELGNELSLQVVFHMVNKEVHDRFGNAVLNIFSHDQEIGLDQAFYK